MSVRIHQGVMSIGEVKTASTAVTMVYPDGRITSICYHALLSFNHYDAGKFTEHARCRTQKSPTEGAGLGGATAALVELFPSQA